MATACDTTCEICDANNEIVFCTGCNEYYCKLCWPKRRSHKDKNQLGPAGIPHEQVEPSVVQLVERCIAEPQNEVEEKKQHELDQDTTWFGLDRDSSGNPVLSEYRRYASIMMETASKTSSARYPGLVSFVGQTGAGKSTLIRLLIDPQTQQNSQVPQVPVSAPVIGRSDCEVPTSADVHLYVDPKTMFQSQPILLADCEGFEGGERDPIASGGGYATPLRSISQKFAAVAGNRHGNNVFRRLVPGTKRALKWAQRGAPNYEKSAKRQYAVAEMYPRIFYAFSDVIVFVLNNPKTMEDMIEKLLMWADANYHKSINLPSKPHAVIAINKCHNSTPDKLWNHDTATADLLRSMNSQLRKNKTFQLLLEKWKSSNVIISDMDNLFRCYYSSVHVIRLPDKSRYQLLATQRGELYDIITECCTNSFNNKRDNRVLADVDGFGLYLSLAFDHFSQTLDEPFDYVQASMKYQPPPETIDDNLYLFAHLVAEKMGIQGEIRRLFSKLVDMVASCLMLDCARKRRFGRPDHWFNAEISPPNPQTQTKNIKTTGIKSSYEAACKAAVENYFQKDVKCNHVIIPGLGRNVPCEQYKANHGSVHRGKGPLSTREDYGSFEHDFNSDEFAWHKQVLARMNMMQTELGTDDTINLRHDRAAAHSKVVQSFYKAHRLYCGHIICLECAKDFGRSCDTLEVVIDECPLNCSQQQSRVNRKPTVIAVAPPHSGLRVLTLDGGGVRGIVELCVLKALENRIGVPLHNFFDLVVGTSTGGIISLGFAHELWSIEQCIERFRSLVNQAFTIRPGQSLHGIRHAEMLLRKSKYHTKPLEEALQTSFGDENLFDVWQEPGKRRLKVAVTAVSEAGALAYVLSNYNVCDYPVASSTKRELKSDYQRYRPRRPEEELKVWEAARGTSAAPGFFKPFSKAPSQNSSRHLYPELMDGALRHNNPVYVAIEEARRLAIAQDQYRIPDIVLSLGTGLPQNSDSKENSSSTPSITKGVTFRKAPFIWTIYNMISSQIKLNLDSEDRWNSLTKELLQDNSWKGRLYRINPDLGEEPPKMDDTSKVQSLSNNVTGWTENNEDIDEIACSLIASSFYFERDKKESHSSNSWIELRGRIRCRLRGREAEVKGLGEFLSSSQRPAAFVINDRPVQHGEHRIEIPVDDMRCHGHFKDISVIINIPSEEAKTTIFLHMEGMKKRNGVFNISGFPRQLMRHDFRPNYRAA